MESTIPEIPLVPLVMAGAGFLLLFAAGIWMLIEGFRAHVLWGLALLFLQPVSGLLFVLLRWTRARNPFVMSLAALALLVGAVFMMPAGTVTADTMMLMATRATSSAGSSEPVKMMTVEEIETRASQLKEREKLLMQQKALVVKNDPASVEALKREIERYNSDLQALKEQPAYAFWQSQKQAPADNTSPPATQPEPSPTQEQSASTP